MRWADKVLLRLRSILHRERIDYELDEELRFHLEQQIEENLAAGLTPEEARYTARRSVGGVAQIKEGCRDMRRINFIDSLAKDGQYALRMMRRSPGFVVIATLSLALGIGANTAIFTLINATLLRPVAGVREPRRLARLTNGSFTYPLFQEVRAHKIFVNTVAFDLERLYIEVNHSNQWSQTLLVSGEYYTALGVNALLGRTITESDDKAHSLVAVLDYHFWENTFSADLDVIGKSFRVNGVPLTIVGVTPPEFTGVIVGKRPDFTVPLTALSQLRPEWDFYFTRRTTHWLDIMGRLEPGQSVRQANARLQVVWPRILAATVPGRELSQDHRTEVQSASAGFQWVGNRFASPLYVMMGLVGIVLLIACANVANLFLVRTAVRQREFAIRLAIGAGRMRLIRQLLTESLLLAIIAALGGMLFAFWGSNLLVSFISSGISPIFLDLRPDSRVLLFTSAVTFVTVLLFGLTPAIRATNSRSASSFRESGRSLTGPGGKLGKILVVSQVALSLVLVVGAGLFLNSLRRILAVDSGFRHKNSVLLVSVDALGAGYRGSRAVDFYARLIERISMLPGVQAASGSWVPPVSDDMGGNNGNASIEGYTPRPGEDMVVWSNLVSPRYFATIGQPLLAGRDFAWRDKEGAPGVAIINQTMMRRFFGDQNPIGKHVTFQEGKVQIIGVVRDAKYQSLTEETLPVLYVPFAQAPGFLETFNLMLEVRSNGVTGSIVGEVRNEIHTFGKNIGIATETLKAHVDQSLTTERLIAMLSGFFSGLALLLAAVGLYGVMAYTVTRRTNEIGIRMAMGAQRSSVVWMVLRGALQLVGTGLAIGAPVALALTRYISSLLFGLKPTDPATISTSIVVLLIVAVVASYLPARRASRVDPMVALRYE